MPCYRLLQIRRGAAVAEQLQCRLTEIPGLSDRLQTVACMVKKSSSSIRNGIANKVKPDSWSAATLF